MSEIPDEFEPFVVPDAYDAQGEELDETGLDPENDDDTEEAVEYDSEEDDERSATTDNQHDMAAHPAFIETNPLSEAEERAAAKREKIMDEVGWTNDERGVDVERIGHYAAALGIKMAPAHIIYDRRNVGDIVRGMFKAGARGEALAFLSVANRNAGTHIGTLGMSFIPRYGSLPAELDASVAHEDVGHGSAGILEPNVGGVGKEALRQLVYLRPNETLRYGLTGRLGGRFLEEGVARIMDQQFLIHTGRALHGPGWELKAPERRHPYNRYSGLDYDKAAMGVSLLCEAEPELFPEIVAARDNPQAGTVRELINDIKPRLLSRLLGVRQDEFGKGLYIVRKATGMIQPIDADVFNNGVVARHIRERLDAYTKATGYQFNRNG